MANRREANVETPGFTGEARLASSVPDMPTDPGLIGAAQAKAGSEIEGALDPIADRLAKETGKQAGTIAGDDPNWRPSAIPTLRQQAFDTAAQDTYLNNLQIRTRGQINQAYQDYTLLPQDQKTPDKLQAALQDIHDDTLDDDVFPSIRPKYTETFDKLAFPYLRKAQDDHDVYVGQQQQASFLGNEQSAAGNTIRAASLGTPDGLSLAQQEAAAHGRLVDEQVNQGNMSPQAGAKLKLQLTQNTLAAYELAKFQALPDAQKAGYADTFIKGYGGGSSGLVNPQAGDDDAKREVRTNNFTNIRDGDWARGQPGYTGAEGGFATFASPEAGIQAANRNLDGYAARGLDTVAGIVNRWSPPTDNNDTSRLIRDTAQRLGVDPNAHLDMRDPAVRGQLISGLISNEIGTPPFTPAQITAALTGNATSGMSAETFRYTANQMQTSLRAVDSANSQARTTSLNEIAGVQKQMTEGFDVPPGVWNDLTSRYAHSTDPAVLQALGQADQIRSYFAGFKGKTPQQIEADVAAMSKGAQDGQGVFAGQVPVIKAAQGYLQKYRADLAADPLRRASNEGVIGNLQPLDFTQPQGLAAGLAARVPQADAAAQKFGIEPKLLLPDERLQLKKLSAEGGAPMIAAAQAVVQQLGPRAGQLFEEAAGDAPKFATAGRVAAWNGAPAFLADFAERQRLAQDPSQNKALELPAKNASDPVADAEIGDSLAMIPSMHAAVKQGARDVYELRALNQNLDRQLAASGAQQTFTRGLQEAAGATFDGDQQYGGIGTRKTGWFSSQKVLAPLAMKSDGVQEALDSLTDADMKGLANPPVAGDLKTPVSAKALQNATLSSLGHGVYAVSLGDPRSAAPQWVMAPKSNPVTKDNRFVLDLNALEPVLRQRVPQLYRTP